MTKELRVRTQEPEPIDLERARQILQAAVLTHESSLELPEDLVRIVGFSAEDIRAVHEVFRDLKSRHRTELDPWNTLFIPKYSPNRTVAALSIEPDPQTIQLIVGPGDGSSIYANFPLTDVDNARRYSMQARFVDHRSGEDLAWSPSYPEKPFDSFTNKMVGSFDISNIQLLFKGARWIFANMLSWDEPGIILPEQLEHLGIPVGRKSGYPVA